MKVKKKGKKSKRRKEEWKKERRLEEGKNRGKKSEERSVLLKDALTGNWTYNLLITKQLLYPCTTDAQVNISKICLDITSLPVWRLFCWIWVAVPDKRLWGSKFFSITFVRLGLKIISGDFEEDLTKIVGGVGFQRFFDKTGNNRKSIQPKIGAIERRIRLDPRNPMVPHFWKSVKRFKSYSVNKSPTLTRWWR